MPCHWRAILTKPCLQGLIDDLLEGFKKLQALGGVSATNGLNTASEERLNVHDIPSNHLLGMNIATARNNAFGSEQTTAFNTSDGEALERRGFRHTSQNFVNAVNTALYRLSRGDDPAIVKVGREWGLRHWYPGWRRRARGEEESVNDETEATPSYQRALAACFAILFLLVADNFLASGM